MDDVGRETAPGQELRGLLPRLAVGDATGKAPFDCAPRDGVPVGLVQQLAEPPGIDPVLKAGVAHLWFVTIHPFDDGNGRIARALADMALAQADGTRDRFYSLSSALEARRGEYYLQLESAQRASLDITAWLVWFLSCLDRTLEDANRSLAAVLEKSRLWQRINLLPVNERQRKVINRMLDAFAGYLTAAKYARLAECSSDTALRDIRGLMSRGILVKNPGGGRSTSYRLADADRRAAMTAAMKSLARPGAAAAVIDWVSGATMR